MKITKFPVLQKADEGGGAGGGAGGGGDKGGGGAPPTPWFSDAHKDYVANKGFKSGDDALVSLQNAEKLIGAEKAGRTLIRPKDDKDVDGIKAWRTGIGVPEKPDDYALPVPDGEEPGFAKVVSGWFHEIGIPKGDAIKLTEKWNEYLKEVIAKSEQALKDNSDKQLGDLKTAWGGEFDKNSEHARRFLREAGLDDQAVNRIEVALGTAQMLKLFHGLGVKMGEHGFMKGDGGGGKVTQAQAREKLDAARQQRVEGKISEAEWLKTLDQYGPIAEPETKAT